jgi:hypothetical protein
MGLHGCLPEPEYRRKLVRLLIEHGPSRCVDLAPLLGSSLQRTSYLMSELNKHGLVRNAGLSGRGARWVAEPGALERIDALHEEALRHRRYLRNTQRARGRARARLNLDAQLDAWASQSVQRVVPAAEAPPLRVRAPNSVFALGDML